LYACLLPYEDLHIVKAGLITLFLEELLPFVT